MINLVIFGAGQQGRICKRLALENSYKVHAFIDDFVVGEVEGIPVFRNVENIKDYRSYKFFIAVGEIDTRKKFCEEIKKHNLETVNLIDKAALIEEGAEIGSGNYIYKSAIIYASAKIGNNNIINCKAVVATDAVIGDNNNISMGCNICGGVHIGNNNYIGCQASVVSGMNVGDDTIVGAGSVVLKDVENGTFVAGAPAVLKRRTV